VEYEFISGLDRSYSSSTRAHVLKWYMQKRQKRKKQRPDTGPEYRPIITPLTLKDKPNEGEALGVDSTSAPRKGQASQRSGASSEVVREPVLRRACTSSHYSSAEDSGELQYYPPVSTIFGAERVDPFSTFARFTTPRENFFIDHCVTVFPLTKHHCHD
jgi:hypothetical protein